MSGGHHGGWHRGSGGGVLLVDSADLSLTGFPDGDNFGEEYFQSLFELRPQMNGELDGMSEFRSGRFGAEFGGKAYRQMG